MAFEPVKLLLPLKVTAPGVLSRVILKLSVYALAPLVANVIPVPVCESVMLMVPNVVNPVAVTVSTAPLTSKLASVVPDQVLVAHKLSVNV